MSLPVNRKIMTFLQENQDKIDWFWLSSNPAAIDLLKENPDKINWSNLSRCYWRPYRHKALLRCGLKRN